MVVRAGEKNRLVIFYPLDILVSAVDYPVVPPRSPLDHYILLIIL